MPAWSKIWNGLKLERLPHFVAFCSVYIGGDYLLSRLSKQSLCDNILERFRAGTKISIPEIPYYCNRTEEVKALYELLHPKERTGRFTVVVGSTGCGKTFTVWKAINENPQVFKYYSLWPVSFNT